MKRYQPASNATTTWTFVDAASGMGCSVLAVKHTDAPSHHDRPGTPEALR